MYNISSTSQKKRLFTNDSVARSEHAETIKAIHALGTFNGHIKTVETVHNGPHPTSFSLFKKTIVALRSYIQDYIALNGYNTLDGILDTKYPNGIRYFMTGDFINQLKLAISDLIVDHTINPSAFYDFICQCQSNGMISRCTVWCAENDGSISIRQADTGAHLLSSSDRLWVNAKAKTTVVKCMQQVHNMMIVGCSDGFIRVYDIHTLELLMEKKHHTGAINSLVHSYYITGIPQKRVDVIFSASDDFNICVSKVEPEGTEEGSVLSKMKQTANSIMSNFKTSNKTAQNNRYNGKRSLSPIKASTKLHGHTMAVKVLAKGMNDDYLYSGSDDGYIRQWTIDQHPQEVTFESFPLFCGPNGVRFIQLYEPLIVFAGNTGPVTIWDIVHKCVCQTISLDRASLAAIQLIPTASALITSDQMGTMTMWHTGTGEIIDEQYSPDGAVSLALPVIGESICLRFWVLGSNGTLACICMETESFESKPAWEPIMQLRKLSKDVDLDNMDASFINKVDDCAIDKVSELIKNNLLIRDKKKKLSCLYNRRKHETSEAINIFSLYINRGLLINCTQKLKLYVNTCYYLIKLRCLSSFSVYSLQLSLLSRYKNKLYLFNMKQKNTLIQQNILESIKHLTESNVKLVALRRAIQYTRKKALLSLSKKYATFFKKDNTLNLLSYTFKKLNLYVYQKKIIGRQLCMSDIAQVTIQKHVKATSWILFNRGVYDLICKRMFDKKITILEKNSQKGTQRKYFNYWLNQIHEFIRLKHMNGIATVFCKNIETTKLNDSFVWWKLYMYSQKESQLRNQRKEMDSKISLFNEKLKKAEYRPLSIVDNEIKQLKKELNNIYLETTEIEKKVEEINKHELVLIQEIASPECKTSEDVISLMNKMNSLSTSLKKYSLNLPICWKHVQGQIQKIREIPYTEPDKLEEYLNLMLTPVSQLLENFGSYKARVSTRKNYSSGSYKPMENSMSGRYNTGFNMSHSGSKNSILNIRSQELISSKDYSSLTTLEILILLITEKFKIYRALVKKNLYRGIE